MADQIRIVLEVDAKTGGLNTVVNGLTNVKSATNSLNASLLSTAKSLLGPFAAGLSVYGLLRFTKATIDNADAMAKQAQSAGMTADRFSALAYSASLADVSSQELIQSTRGLNQWLKTTGQTGKDLQQVMLEQADLFSRMPDGMDKVRLAQERFGRGGAQLLPFLNQGSQAIRDQMEEARLFGATIGPRFSENAQTFNDNLTRIYTIFRGMFNMLADALLPTFIALQESFINWVKNTGANIAVVDSLIQAYQGLAATLMTLRLGLDTVTDGWAGLSAAIGNFTVTGGVGSALDAGNERLKAMEEYVKRIDKLFAIGRKQDIAIPSITTQDSKISRDPLAVYEETNKRLENQLSEQRLLEQKLRTPGYMQIGGSANGPLENARSSAFQRMTGSLVDEEENIRRIITEQISTIGAQRLESRKAASAGVISPEKLKQTELEYEQKIFDLQSKRLKLIEEVAAKNQENVDAVMGIEAELIIAEEANKGFFDQMTSNLEKLSEQFDNVGASIADVVTNGIGNAINTVADGMWQVIDGTATWGEMFRNVGRNIISDLVRIGMQEIVVATLKKGIVMAWKTMTSALRAADVVEANATEVAKTPALATNATLASVSSWGIAAAIGVAAILAVLAMVGGFESGGIVAGGEKFIRVNEQGPESVLNARATAMLGPEAIASMNAGRIHDLQARIAGNLSVPSEFAPGGSAAAFASESSIRGAGQATGAQSLSINLILVDSRNSQAAQAFMESSAGKTRIVEIVRDHKTEVGLRT